MSYQRLTNSSVDSRNSGAVRLLCDNATALKRLHAYENTGLSPDEILNLKNKLVDARALIKALNERVYSRRHKDE